MSKKLQIIIGIAVLIAAVSVFYYFVFFISQKEAQKKEAQLKEQEIQSLKDVAGRMSQILDEQEFQRQKDATEAQRQKELEYQQAQQKSAEEARLAKIESCKVFADLNAGVDAYETAKKARDLVVTKALEAPDESQLTFTEKLNNLNTRLRWAIELGKSTYDTEYSSVYNQKYPNYYLECLNK